jgi:hypothetical protein
MTGSPKTRAGNRVLVPSGLGHSKPCWLRDRWRRAMALFAVIMSQDVPRLKRKQAPSTAREVTTASAPAVTF